MYVCACVCVYNLYVCVHACVLCVHTCVYGCCAYMRAVCVCCVYVHVSVYLCMIVRGGTTCVHVFFSSRWILCLLCTILRDCHYVAS